MCNMRERKKREGVYIIHFGENGYIKYQSIVDVVDDDDDVGWERC